MLKKIASTFATKSLTAFINLAIIIFISRWIGAEGKGIHGLFIATLAIVTTLMGVLGLISLTYLVPQKKTANYFLIADLWSIIVSFAIYFFLNLGYLVPKEFAFQLSIISFFASVAGNHLSIFFIKERITFYNLVILIQPLLNIVFIIGIFIIKRTFTIEDYIHSLTASYLILFVISLKGMHILIKEKFPIILNEFYTDVLSMFRYGFINQLATLIQMVSFRGTYFILDSYTSTFEVGIYSNAVSIAESVWIISRSLAMVFYSRVINTKSKPYHIKLYRRFSSLAFWMQFSALLFLLIIPANIFVDVFGEDFKNLKTIIIYLIPAMLFFGQSLISGHYFSGTGKHHINLLSNFIGMVVILILCFILIPDHYTVGAAISTGIGYFFILLIHSIYLKKFIGLSLLQQFIDLRLILRWLKFKKIH